MDKHINFCKEEVERYSRHLIIPELGMQGQSKLKSAKVLVVGAGGLGSPLLLYLAAAGVGTIGIVDFDLVEESNLQRQVLFTMEDLGQSKAERAKKRLENLNPHIDIVAHHTALSAKNAFEIIKNYDLVADGTDNFPTRYLVNDACVFLNKPNIYGSIFRFEGQVSVFNYRNKKGVLGPNYRDLYPMPPKPDLVPSCAEAGVIGVLPGIIGSLQASEVIKVITGLGEPLSGRLFLFEAASFTTRTFNIRRNPENPINGENPTQTTLIDYKAFCGITERQKEDSLKNITVQELKALKDSQADFQLIDVREEYEYTIANLGGVLIPISKIDEEIARIASEKKVILHCRSGKRSREAIEYLEKTYGFTNLHNLKGGLLAWIEEVDGSLPKY